MAFITLLLIGLISFSFIDYNQEAYASECNPFEENLPHTITVPWTLRQDESSEVAVYKDGVMYATCDIDTNCMNYFNHLTNTVVQLSGDGTLIIQHKVLNATRKDVGVWSIKYIQGIQTERSIVSKCNLRSYTKLTNIDCQKYLTYTGLEIICKSQRVFPEAKCHFSVNNFEDVLNNSWRVIYDNEPVYDGNTVYYNTDCKLHLPLHVVSNGTYTVNVYMYPNVTGDVKDMEFGNMTSLDFVIDESITISLKDCDDNSTHLVPKVCVLKSHDITPSGSNKHKIVLPEVETKLQGSCEINTEHNDIHILCSYEHDPGEGVQCQLFIQQDQNLYIIVEAVSESLVAVSNTFTSYNSHCSFIVYGDYIKPGLYHAYVSAKTTENYDKTDKNYTINFELEVKRPIDSIGSREIFEESIATNVLLIIVSVAALISVAVIVILVLAIKYKYQIPCHQSRNVTENHYEEVRDDNNNVSLIQKESPMLSDIEIVTTEMINNEAKYITPLEC